MKKTAIYQRKRVHAPHWFNKWVQSTKWFYGFWILSGVFLIVYLVSESMEPVRPGSPLGMAFGIGATGALLAVLLYTVRRRTMKFRPPGKAWTYLQIHVYGGALFLALMLMHTGFSVPFGVHTWWLWLLSLWVVGSGFLGIVLQKWLPTVLNAGLSTEVHFLRIPELLENIRTRTEKLALASGDQIRDFYQNRIAPTLTAPEVRLIYFVDITGGMHRRIKPFDYLRKMSTKADQEALDEIQKLYQMKLELDAHYTLQRALRTWLVLHVPLSIVLVVLLAVHIFSVLYF